jgi:prepilin-type N-terminal cleavage/methylation domain-containing protein
MQSTIERLRQRREELDDQGGFTLIELLIVIVILGILAAIVVFAVQNLTGSSAQASCKADYKTVETAVEAFNAQQGHYPTNTTDAGTPGGATPYTSATYTIPATDLVGALMTQQGTGGNGPWLRDFPGNGTHYQIVVTANAGNPSNIIVSKTDGTPVVTNSTGGAADCGSVK